MLDLLARDDPSFVWRVDEETGQMLICGVGELHLEVLRHRIEREFRMSVRVGEPRVAYRQTLLGPSNQIYLGDRTAKCYRLDLFLDDGSATDADRQAARLATDARRVGMTRAIRPCSAARLPAKTSEASGARSLAKRTCFSAKTVRTAVQIKSKAAPSRRSR